jgi:hypothetical protein
MPLRYVILRHEQIDSPHFDLMFETSPGSLLATWRSDAWPITRPTVLLRLPDHRAHYLEYEGPLSAARGSVRRVESGILTYGSQAPAHVEIVLSNHSRTIILKLVVDAARGEPHWTAEPADGA